MTEFAQMAGCLCRSRGSGKRRGVGDGSGKRGRRGLKLPAKPACRALRIGCAFRSAEAVDGAWYASILRLRLCESGGGARDSVSAAGRLEPAFKERETGGTGRVLRLFGGEAASGGLSAVNRILHNMDGIERNPDSVCGCLGSPCRQTRRQIKGRPANGVQCCPKGRIGGAPWTAACSVRCARFDVPSNRPLP